MKMDELRSDYLKVLEENKAKAKLEELIDQINKKQTSNENTHTERSQEKPAFDPNEIESLVSKKIREHEISSKERENFNTVKIKLKEKLGSEYQAILNKQMETLGLTEEQTNGMARANPNLFYKVFGLDQTNTPYTNIPGSSINTAGLRHQEPERTLSYYQNLRKTNPRLYSDPKINIQMDKDAQRLGEKFFDV